MPHTAVAYSIKDHVASWGYAPEVEPSFDIVVLKDNEKDLGDIMSLQRSVEHQAKSSDNPVKRFFLKERTPQTYQDIIDSGGLVIGIRKDNFLVAAACVNTAIDGGRAEVSVDDAIDVNKIGVFQAAMVHPDVQGKGYNLADILFTERMKWAFDNNKKHVFASACSSVYNLYIGHPMHNPDNKSGDPEKNGNYRVINGLKKKGFEENATSTTHEGRYIRLELLTLGFTLPETSKALYTHLRNVVHEDVAKKCLPNSTLRPV